MDGKKQMIKSNGNYIVDCNGGGEQQEVVGEKIITEKYRCNTCNKSFTSHQALGGHRSSHNKLKMSIVNHGHDQDHDQDQDDKDQGHNNNNNNNNNHIISNGPNLAVLIKNHDDVDVDRSHVCNVCDKAFSTGEALGGHKRSHSGDRAPKLVLDFDLNKIPESQDGGGGGGLNPASL